MKFRLSLSSSFRHQLHNGTGTCFYYSCFYSHFIYDDMYSEPQICHSPVSWGINMTRTRYLSLHSSLMVMWRVEPVLSEGSGGLGSTGIAWGLGIGGDVLATRHEKGCHAQQAQHLYMMKWLIKSPLTKG